MYPPFLLPREIRTLISATMSEIYRGAVPRYRSLLELEADVNERILSIDPGLRRSPDGLNEFQCLVVERHGAIGAGTPQELAVPRCVLAIMGMKPGGYYDLPVAGVPVHAMGFRPIGVNELANHPFRVFTSLMRLDLIQDEKLREEAQTILARRQVFTIRALQLTKRFESTGGLTASEALEFATEVLETFRWHRESTVDAPTYERPRDAHRLLADVACVKGSHVNHLTLRTLDIDAAQTQMVARALGAKEVIAGPLGANTPFCCAKPASRR